MQYLAVWYVVAYEDSYKEADETLDMNHNSILVVFCRKNEITRIFDSIWQEYRILRRNFDLYREDLSDGRITPLRDIDLRPVRPDWHLEIEYQEDAPISQIG